MLLIKKHIAITVSIIITNHNYDKYLKECLDSLVKQSKDKIIEVIIINDGCDNRKICSKIIKSFEPNLNIICEFVEYHNPLLARKHGFELSKGNYIIFIDADDFLGDDYIECAINKVDECDIIYSDVQYFGDCNNRSIIDENIDSRNIALYNFLHVGCMVSRKSIIVSNAFDHIYYGNDYHEDWFFWRKIISKGFKIRKQKGLYYARIHKTNRSDNIKNLNYFNYRGSSRDTISLCGFPSSIHNTNQFAKYQSWPIDQTTQYILKPEEQSVTKYYQRIPYVDKIQVLNHVSICNTSDYIFFYDVSNIYDIDICKRLLKHMDSNFGIVHDNKYKFMSCTLVSGLLIRNQQYINFQEFKSLNNINYIN